LPEIFGFLAIGLIRPSRSIVNVAQATPAEHEAASKCSSSLKDFHSQRALKRIGLE
jgi:hypothetical protein